jgi:raffinose/stachyose/melibiose transport system permease protein
MFMVRGEMMQKAKQGQLIGWQLLFTGVTIATFLLSIGIPFVYGFVLSLFDLKSVSGQGSFAWLSNYVEAFKDEAYWTSLWITIKYTAYTVVLTNVLAFAMAFLVTSGTRGQNVVRAAIFMPNMIGGIVLGYIWVFIIGRVFMDFGESSGIALFQRSFFGEPELAFMSLVIVSVWQQSGYMMIVLIAGLLNVPRDLIEAAMIDGAGAWQRLRAIILPMMVPAFLVTLFLTLRNSFLVYDLNLSLTAGDPYNSTEFVSMYLVNVGLRSTGSDFGLAQAEAIILFVIVAAIAWAQFAYGKRKEVEA